MTPETDGRAPARGDPTDPSGIAGARRDTPAGAAAKASRQVWVPHRSRRQKKALWVVPGSLKRLRQGTEEPR
ncbi:hypothetical protein [Urbifossiella limnaea]|uniref:Uncharacterized protein n=1 Tax=Urbifossiella limnaea TaxID=2528023 RepID=A0A517XWC8_9BACT|nr:hypothetical protein [Urbifossiella limnaea]QDU21810.1 hypothetical protein ETAA1_37830 [Urbifossiella limnaea]